ncbi:MAG: 6,7-dimethyl-8-ribityllumazine synthase [Pseudomonadota bacterium]|nr:6,7-dimethyl-8-ribityllumazine synthase [Pseudomonadota bacterium]
MAANILIVEARYYDHIGDGLLAGAEQTLKAEGATWTVVQVPGALEIPGAIAMAEEASENGGVAFDGYVALGCVIRGETLHFEIVSNESARGLMDLTIYDGLAIGNGILTVENEAQALVRADPSQKNKGGEAARAALTMIGLRDRFASAE